MAFFIGFSGAGDNFGLLISNPCSKTQYQQKIRTRMPLFFSLVMLFSQSLAHKLITNCLKSDISLVKIG